MTVWTKQGVCGDLQPIAWKGLGRVAEAYHQVGKDLYLTSIRDGNHMAGSLHYIGLAFDIRYAEGVSLERISRALGPNWDVVPERNHIHCEYDKWQQPPNGPLTEAP